MENRVLIIPAKSADKPYFYAVPEEIISWDTFKALRAKIGASTAESVMCSALYEQAPYLRMLVDEDGKLYSPPLPLNKRATFLYLGRGTDGVFAPSGAFVPFCDYIVGDVVVLSTRNSGSEDFYALSEYEYKYLYKLFFE